MTVADLGLSWNQQRQVLLMLVAVEKQLPHVRTPAAKQRRACMKRQLIVAGLRNLGLLPSQGCAS